MKNAGGINIESLATCLLSDYDQHRPGAIFLDGLQLTLKDAWQLQHAVARMREERGERVVVYKIGCVSSINQNHFGLSHPVWGRIWSTEQYESDVRLSKADFANVAVEAEFGVILGQTVDSNDTSLASIFTAVEKVFIVIELHNAVFYGGDPNGHELIATNAIHAGVVRGQEFKPERPAMTNLILYFDNTAVDIWNEIRWPDDILPSVSWLADQLATEELSLEKGQTILTGAFGSPRTIGAASHSKVVFSRFGTVEALFT